MNTIEAQATAAAEAFSPRPDMPLATAGQASASLAAYAMSRGASMPELKALLELQVAADNHQLALMRQKREWDAEDRGQAQELAFRRDFAAFRGENIVVPKSKYVDRGSAGSFMQAEYSEVADRLSPALSKHGFGFRHDMVFGAKRWMTGGVESDVAWVYVTCFLEHREGHTESLALEGPPGELSANTPVQNMQATGSYLKRQSLLAITGTATGGEDDEAGMAGKFKARRPDPDSKVAAESSAAQQAAERERAALIEAGQEWSTKGLKELTAWWGALKPQQRNGLMPQFAGWRKAAQQFDADNAPKGARK